MDNEQRTKEDREKQLLSKLFTPLSEVVDEPKTYVFSPYVPSGKLTGLIALPGVGKTKFADGLAAYVSAGKPMFGNVPCEKSGSVLIFSTEDDCVDHKKTVAACGGNMEKVFILSQSDAALDWTASNPVKFSSPIIETAIKSIRPAMVIFDPIQQYFGRIDSNSQTETSSALAPLVKLARKYDCAIVLVGHAGKGNNDSLQAKAIGSTNIVGQMRSMLSIVRDPECPSENIVIHVKSNNVHGDSIRYKILPIPDDEDFAKVEFIRTEKYSESDYRKSIKQMERIKAEEEITEDDPIVKTILHLANQNKGLVRIGRKDMEKAVETVGSDYLSEGLESICKRYGSWLQRNHGISIKTGTSQPIKPFRILNEIMLPEKSPDRVISIKQSTYSPP
uniref:Putative ATP-dependent serine protease n=1 Tax=uncultured bacterium Contig1777 TaxID=1393514 RepID=W0FQN6_9BACT|nr:putative ATP-dependent serine protease [uncultured bacterium Contig1777]